MCIRDSYKRVPILEAIKNETGLDIEKLDDQELSEKAKNIGVEVDSTMGRGKIIDSIFGDKCESNFIQPTFIID